MSTTTKPKKGRAKKASPAKKQTTAQLTKAAIAECDKNLVATPAKSNAGTAKPPGTTKTAKMSGLDAAAKILAAAKEPMSTRDIAAAARAKGLWKPAGKTPHATLYSAIIREISKKAAGARFKKSGRGRFTLRKKAA